jgi:hypothetical protein
MANKASAEKIPHSWAIDHWPVHVYPHSASRARYIVRANKTALVAAGALSRVGRDLVVLGAGYSAWLAKQGGRVESFEVESLSRYQAAKRERAGQQNAVAA